MAKFLEGPVAPCPAPFMFAVTAPLSPISICGSSNKLPRFRGLRIQTNSPKFSFNLVSWNQGISRQGGRIICEAQDTTVQVGAVNDLSWESDVLKSELPVLVEFWAPWCGPCRMIEPVIFELSKQFEGKVKCCKVNTDECPSIATQYGIRSIPTVIIFKGGEKRESVIGAVPKSTLVTSLEKFL